MGFKVPVGLSNKHVHLSEADLATLFGADYKLTWIKDLGQPGQFACDEKVDIVGPKGTLKGIRILGPVRKESQVELAMTDARGIGTNPPLRESGMLDGTPGIKLVGPKGEVELEKGMIITQRHIHITPPQAKEFGVVDKQIVQVKKEGPRGLIFDNVVVRVREDFALEIHFDTDEGNAAGLKNDELVDVLV